MSDKVGSIRYELTLDTSAFDRATALVKTKLAGVNTSLHTSGSQIDSYSNKSGSSFMSLAGKAGLAAGAILGLGWAVKATAGPFVNVGIEAQNLRTNLDVLTGSAQKGGAMFKNLTEMADKTPFESVDLTQATATMLAMGISTERVLPNLQMLGDISMGNKDKLQSLALVYGQITAKGRLMGDDIRQLWSIGFNPLDYWVQKSGKSMEYWQDQMSEGKVTTAMVTEAMVSATSAGGRFFGGMDKASKTLSGRMSTLQDTAKKAIRSMLGIDQEGNIKKGGLFDRISTSLEKLFPYMEKLAKEAGPAVASIMAFVDEVMRQLQPAIKALTDEVKKFWEENKNWLIPTLKMVAAIIGTALLASLVILGGVLFATLKAFHILREAMEWVINTITNLSIHFVNLYNTIISTFVNSANWLYYRGRDIVQGLINGVASMGASVWWAIKGVADQIGNFFGGAWSWLYNTGVAIAQGLINGLRDMIYWVGRTAGELASTIINKLKSFLGIRSPSKVMYGLGTNIAQGLVNGIDGGLSKVSDIASNLAMQVQAPAIETANLAQKGALSTSTTTIGDVYISDKQSADYFFDRLNRNNELTRKGMAVL